MFWSDLVDSLVINKIEILKKIYNLVRRPYVTTHTNNNELFL
jgi:hypothetical protein